MSEKNYLKYVFDAVSKFYNQPNEELFRSILRLLGILLLASVVLSFIYEMTGIGEHFSADPLGVILILFVAWLLLVADVTKMLIGLFLIFVFSLSICFLIYPIDQMASVVRQSIGMDDSVTTELNARFAEVKSEIRYAKFQLNKELKNKVNTAPNNKRDVMISGVEPIAETLERAQKRFDELYNYSLNVIQPVVPTGSGLPGWARTLAENIERALRVGAPFIFSMLLGALGSSIVITQQFITNYKGQKPAWYLYRLIQGMTIALLIVYGLAAGILSLGGQQQPIDFRSFEQNKYFIGFISALAGLFSEHAFAKLQDISSTIFSPGKARDKGIEAADKNSNPKNKDPES